MLLLLAIAPALADTGTDSVAVTADTMDSDAVSLMESADTGPDTLAGTGQATAVTADTGTDSPIDTADTDSTPPDTAMDTDTDTDQGDTGDLLDDSAGTLIDTSDSGTEERSASIISGEKGGWGCGCVHQRAGPAWVWFAGLGLVGFRRGRARHV